MGYSALEQRYMDRVLSSVFPDVMSSPEPMAAEPSLDGVQLAAADVARLPEVVVTGEPEADGPSGPAGEPQPRFGRGGVTKAQSDAAGGLEVPATALIDTLAGALRGTVAQSLGLPGDIESLVRLLSGGKQVLPTTEQVNEMLPPVVPPSAPNAAERQKTADVANLLGEYNPLLGAPEAAKLAVKGAKAAGKALAPTVGDMAEDYLRKTGGLMQAAPDIKVFDEPIQVQPTINVLSSGVDNAIAQLTTLNLQARITRVQQANQSLAKFLGTDNKTGKTKPLLTTNGKLLKTEKGVEGGEPIMLPDGRNVESAGLALSPAFKQGKFTTCPNSASCAGDCLGKTSGGYFFMGGGADLNALKGPRMRSFELTQAFMRDPENFAIKLNDEITALKIKAAQNGNHLAIRLNVLSDINPRVYEKVIKSHPDVTFYDYTKNNTNPIAPNHHYTYSSTGVSQPSGYNGLTEAINNPNQNWKQMRRRLDSGSNVAMAFSHKSILPERVIDEETGKIYKVIDGDTYDFRPLDIQPPGVDGVIVGLRNKANTRKEATAAKDSSGFFVHFDPQIQKVKGKQVRDEAGRPVYGNRDVTIAKQGSGQVTLTNDYQPLKESK